MDHDVADTDAGTHNKLTQHVDALRRSESRRGALPTPIDDSTRCARRQLHRWIFSRSMSAFGHPRRTQSARPAANVRNVPKADIVWAQSRGQLVNARMSRPGPPPMTRIHLSGDERLVGPPLAMGCQQPCSVVTGVVSFSAFNVARGVVAEFPAW